MKRFAWLLVLLCLLLPTTAKSQDGFGRSSMEVINDMAPGWNLGNTLEGVAAWAGVDFLNNKGGVGKCVMYQVPDIVDGSEGNVLASIQPVLVCKSYGILARSPICL